MNPSESLEVQYLLKGPYEVASFKMGAIDQWGDYHVYYPKDSDDSTTYPLVIFVNGTGVYAKKYPALFKHLASYGFIVAGNDDPSTYSGDSSNATLVKMLELNDDPTSALYGKIDVENIELSGHSQGGVAVFIMLKNQPHGNMVKTIVSLSPIDPQLAKAIHIPYDPSDLTIPILLLASDNNDVIQLEGMKSIFDSMVGPRVMALRKDIDLAKRCTPWMDM